MTEWEFGMSDGTRVGANDKHILAAIQRGDLTADAASGHVTYRGRTAEVGSRSGYITVLIRRHEPGCVRVYAHRVVWLCHRPLILPGWEVNHRNSRRWDNRLSNLELVTRTDNQRHAHGTDYSAVGDSADANAVDPDWYAKVLELAADPNATTADIQALKTLLPVEDSAPAVFAGRPLTRPTR